MRLDQHCSVRTSTFELLIIVMYIAYNYWQRFGKTERAGRSGLSGRITSVKDLVMNKDGLKKVASCMDLGGT